ncbi:hypothetical protein AYI68_g6390, partial [Smittium mucronatum]
MGGKREAGAIKR